MIKLQIIGNLGRDCIVNSVNGKSVINFSVAHAEKYKDANGEQKTKTTWVECSYWTDKTAIAPYLKKGTTVYIEGKPEAKVYQKDSETIPKLTMRVTNVQLLGNKSEVNNTQQATQTQQQANNKTTTAPEGSFIDEQDDLPF